MQTKKHFIAYGTREINFHLVYSDRKTLQIAVYPDRSVQVTAPDDAAMEKIYSKVKKRASWIVKQQRYFDRFRKENLNFDYVSGETHRYLGRQYRLKVNQIENGTNEGVKLKGAFIHIFTYQKENPDYVKSLLEKWYRHRASVKFDERIQKCADYLETFRISKPEFKIQKMEKRWGSYTPSGRILLNPDLIRYPTYCIDYVIIHEMCHVKYPDHSNEFYRLLAKVLPDWEYRKKRLERMD